MNTVFDSIIGNKALMTRLSRSVNEGTLSHAYILEGDDGSGRHEIALQLIAAMSCMQRNTEGASVPCGNCIHCRKILEGRSPDIMRTDTEKDKATIGVDAMRAIKNSLLLAPTDLSVKAYIIDRADLLTPQAQNALLLSLEEPPEYVMFFLICNSSASLLETVRSRAPVLRTEKISPADIEAYLLKHHPEAKQLKSRAPEEFSEIVFAAQGSIGKAVSLLDPKARKQVLDNRHLAAELIRHAAQKQSKDKLDIIFSLGTKRAEICDRLLYVQAALRDLILIKKSYDCPLCFYCDREQASELSTSFTSIRLIEMLKATEDAIDDLDRNSNTKLTLMNMLKRSNLI